MRRTAGILLLLSGCMPAATPPAPTAAATCAPCAETVLRGGKIFLADSAGTAVAALALRDGRVLAAGSEEEVARVTGPATEVVELEGRLVTPGFNDAHLHLASGGISLLSVGLQGARSVAEVERRVADAVADAEPGEWIVGRGWDQTLFPASDLDPSGWPTKAALDRAAPDNPVYLNRVDGHTAWVNSRALALAGITRATRDPEGGGIVRDAAGEPTGILKEDPASQLVSGRIPEPTPAQIRRGLRAAMELAARTGVTSATTDVDPRAGGGAGRADIASTLRVLQDLRAADSLTMRLYVWFPLQQRYIESFRTLGVKAGFGDEWLRIGILKGYTDGTLGSRTASMLEPFSDDPSTHGLAQYRPGQLDSLVLAADRAGLQVMLHAIGDAANREALDAFGRARAADVHRERRHRIEHAQVVDRADLPRFRELGVIASMQPTHATSDMRWAETRIGRERAVEGAYAWRSLLDAGATVIFGTDFAVEPMAPVEGIYSAVTRQSRDEPGTPAGGWLPEQRLTAAEAIRLYTAAPAYGEWEEHRKGTLRPGMLADLVVWDRDLLTVQAEEILEAAPVMTMVGGRVVYRAEEAVR